MNPYFTPPSRDDQADWQWQQREETVERKQFERGKNEDMDDL